MAKYSKMKLKTARGTPVVVEKLVLDTNPLLMDALSAIQVLSREIESLKAELALRS